MSHQNSIQTCRLQVIQTTCSLEGTSASLSISWSVWLTVDSSASTSISPLTCQLPKRHSLRLYGSHTWPKQSCDCSRLVSTRRAASLAKTQGIARTRMRVLHMLGLGRQPRSSATRRNCPASIQRPATPARSPSWQKREVHMKLHTCYRYRTSGGASRTSRTSAFSRRKAQTAEAFEMVSSARFPEA